MAEKRMFTQKITDSDAFLSMPLSSQALYFHLNMNADDDGFVRNPKKIARNVMASEDDLKLLIVKRFIIAFDSGVIVIKHWRMHNALKMDRYHPTEYIDELRTLGIKENKSYTDHLETAVARAMPLNEQKKLEPQRITDGAQAEHKRSTDGTSDIDIGLDIDKGLDIGLELDKGLEEELNIEEESLSVSKETDCRFQEKRPDEKHKVVRNDVYQVIAAWNSLGLKSVERISGESRRGAMTRKRIQDYGVEKVVYAIENVRKSKFLMGNNKKGWMATYDWFIRPENFQKVLEGNYDDYVAQKEGKQRSGFAGIYYEDFANDFSEGEVIDC